MAENRVDKTVPSSSPRLSNVVLWLAFFGMVIGLSRMVYEEQKIDQLQRDLQLLRLQSQQEISDLRNAQSASLEQDLSRLDQLRTQLSKTSAAKANRDVVDPAKTLAGPTKSDLSKTVEPRHPETIGAVSDVRSDVRPGTNAHATAPAREAPIASAEVQAGSGESDAVNSPAGNRSSSATVAPGDAREDPPAAPSPKKKRFWEKLNPFGRKKQESGANGL
jgi:hypothetical protein